MHQHQFTQKGEDVPQECWKPLCGLLFCVRCTFEKMNEEIVIEFAAKDLCVSHDRFEATLREQGIDNGMSHD